MSVVTFARFYGLHVLLLPPATMVLIAVHLYLVRKHGVAPVPADAGGPDLVPVLPARSVSRGRRRFSVTVHSSSRSRNQAWGGPLVYARYFAPGTGPVG